MKTVSKISIIVVTCLLVGGRAQDVNSTRLYQQIDNLGEKGVRCRFIDNETVELTQDWSGFRRLKTLREPDEVTIRRWLQADSIPLLEIDPSTIDTVKYSGWYHPWTSIPISNGFGLPIMAGDIDHNGRIELYGNFRDYSSTDWSTRIYELDSSGMCWFHHEYVPRRGPSMQFTDVDGNGLQEICFFFGDSAYFYEQPAVDSLPVRPKVVFCKYAFHGSAMVTREHVEELDGDALVDFLYRGSQPESSGAWAGQYYTCVAEYDSTIMNFQKVWQTQFEPPPGESGLGGYDVGDYDHDGKMNFLASDWRGRIWVCENTGDNLYSVAWKDSIPFVNLDYQTSGDVDRDSVREFFVGATMSSGNWTIMYEANGDDYYVPKFAFHLISGGSLDEPTYMTKDIDGDGNLELIIWSGGFVYVFKSNADNSYYLWYFSRQFDGMNINFVDLNGDGKMDIVVGKENIDSLGQLRYWSDLYLASTVDDVNPVKGDGRWPREAMLWQNYPNPFNPTTCIRFQTPRKEQVSLTVYDILGRKVTPLISGVLSPGEHSVSWNAASYPSGIYIYQLRTGSGAALTRKMLLVK